MAEAFDVLKPEDRDLEIGPGDSLSTSVAFPEPLHPTMESTRGSPASSPPTEG
jgi:hypothetical protein